MGFLLCGAALGCGEANQSQSLPQESSNLKRIAVLYGRYIATHRGAPPKDEGEFKGFINSLPAEEKAGLPPVDELFVSQRDHQPYVIVYSSGQAHPGAPAVMGYEQAGVEGKRFVANTLGKVEEVDAAGFGQRVPAAK